MRRIAVYFDGGPLSDAIRGQGMSMDMDYMGLVRGLVADGDIVAAHFISAEFPAFPYPKKYENEKKRFQIIAAQGIELHLTKPQVVGSIFIDRGVESVMTAKLILDAQADVYDTALVISRRAELSTAINAVRAIGKTVEVAYQSFALDPVNPLDEFADRAIVISVEEIVAQRRSGPKPPGY